MSVNGDLALIRIHLKPPEQWSQGEQGLWYLLPRAGAGTYAFAGTTYHVAAGDVMVLNNPREGKLHAAVREGLLFDCFSVFIDHLSPMLTCNELCLVNGVTKAFYQPKLYPAACRVAANGSKTV